MKMLIDINEHARRYFAKQGMDAGKSRYKYIGELLESIADGKLKVIKPRKK